jgi:hypothetical protein
MERKETGVCNAHSWGHFTFGNTCPLSQVKIALCNTSSKYTRKKTGWVFSIKN